jgi:hypothetical protein
MTDFEQELATLESSRIEAKIAADLVLLAHLLDDRLVYQHGSGGADNKAQYLEKIRTGSSVYHGGQSRIHKIMMFADTALMFTRIQMDATIMGASKRIDSAALLVWARGEASWRLIAHQPTVMPMTVQDS